MDKAIRMVLLWLVVIGVLAWLALVVLEFTSCTAHATSFVLPKGADFADSADVIAKVGIESIQSFEEKLGATSTIATEIKARVIEPYKGVQSNEAISIFQPGGKVGGRIVWFDGSPEYVVGEQVLVFLKVRADGTLGTHYLTLGRIPLANGVTSKSAMLYGDVPLQDFRAGMLARFGPSRSVLPHIARQMVFHGAAENQTAFRFLNPPSRWRSDTVPVIRSLAFDPKLGQADSLLAIVDGVRAWASAGTSLHLADGGVDSPINGCANGKIGVAYGDPFGVIDKPVNCGGVLAVGGFCASGQASGDNLRTINGGLVTIADGWDGCSFWTERNVSEVLTHELGHAIGLAHSAESTEAASSVQSDATMYWMAHFDGRGATLHAYDRGAVAALYGGVGSSPTPTPTTTPKVTATPTPKPTGEASATPRPEPSASGSMTGNATLTKFLATGSVDFVSQFIVPKSLDMLKGLTIVLATPDDQHGFSAQGGKNGWALRSASSTDLIDALSYRDRPQTRINFRSTAIPEAFAFGPIGAVVGSGSETFGATLRCSKKTQTIEKLVYTCR